MLQFRMLFVDSKDENIALFIINNVVWQFNMSVENPWEFAHKVSIRIEAEQKHLDKFAEKIETSYDINEYNRRAETLDIAMADAYWFATKNINSRESCSKINRYDAIKIVKQVLKKE